MNTENIQTRVLLFSCFFFLGRQAFTEHDHQNIQIQHVKLFENINKSQALHMHIIMDLVQHTKNT